MKRENYQELKELNESLFNIECELSEAERKHNELMTEWAVIAAKINALKDSDYNELQSITI